MNLCKNEATISQAISQAVSKKTLSQKRSSRRAIFQKTPFWKASFQKRRKSFALVLSAFMVFCFVLQANIAKPLADTLNAASQTLPATLGTATNQASSTAEHLAESISSDLYAASAQTAQSVQAASKNNTNQQSASNGITYNEETNTLFVTSGTYTHMQLRNAIYPHKDEMVRAVFNSDSSGDTTITDSSSFGWGEGMFQDCSALTDFDVDGGTVKFGGANAKATYMFYNCPKLTTLDLSSFDTRGVTSIEALAGQCPSLEYFNFSTLETDEVTDISYLLQNDANLRSVDLSNFETDNVTSMEGTFQGCTNLEVLNLSTFNLVNTADATFMFDGCIPHSLTLSSAFFNGSQGEYAVANLGSYYSYNASSPYDPVITTPTNIHESAFAGSAPQTQIFIRDSPLSICFNAGKGKFSGVAPLAFVECAPTAVNSTRVSAPSEPPRRSDGAEFLGWAENPEATSVITDFPLFIKAPGTYYAIWTFDVTYNLNYSGSPQPTTVSVVEGTEITNVPQPTRGQGITFKSWNKDEEGTDPWDFENDIVTANTTLYASWNMKTVFQGNGGTWASLDYQTTSSVSKSPLILPSTDPARTGYRFLGYFTSSTGGDQVTEDTPTPDVYPSQTDTQITYYAHWVEEHTITFAVETNGNPSDPSGGTTNPDVAKVTNDDATCSSVAQANKEYAFIGWYKDGAEITSEETLQLTKPSTGWQDTTYTAKFIDVEATITYESSEGGTTNPQSETLSVFAEKAQGSIATPDSANHYNFDGWYEGDTLVSSDTYFVPEKPQGQTYWTNVTYTAKFVKETEYQLSFGVNDPNGGSVDLTSESVYEGEEEAGEVTATPADNYVFNYWTLSIQGGSETIVSTDAAFKPHRPKDGWGSGFKYTANFAYTHPTLLNFSCAGAGYIKNDIAGTPYVKSFSLHVNDSDSSVTVNAQRASSVGTGFQGWFKKVGDSWQKVSSEPEFTIQKGGDSWNPADYQAEFSSTVTLQATPSAGGVLDNQAESVTIAVDDPYAQAVGQSVTAYANSHFQFEGWYIQGTSMPVSTSANWTPNLADLHISNWNDLTMYARFAPLPQFTLSFYVDTKGGGSAGAGGDVEPNSETVWADDTEAQPSTATPNAGFAFIGWYEGDNLVSTQNRFIPQKPATGWEDAMYTARFAPESATLSFAAAPEAGGAVSDTSVEVASDTDSVTVTATANKHYKFAGWYRPGQQQPVSTDATWNLTKPAEGYWTNATYEAHFIQLGQHTITYTPATLPVGSSTSGGAVTTASEIVFDDDIVAPIGSTAVANPGYQFVGWSEDAAGTKIVSFDQDFHPTEPLDGWQGSTIPFYAIFAPDSWPLIRFAAEGNGTCTPAATVVNPDAEPSTISSVAKAMRSNQFMGWKDSTGATISQNEELTLEKPATGWSNTTYVAKFAREHKVTIPSQPANGKIVVLSEKAVEPEGERVFFEVIPNEGYELDGMPLAQYDDGILTNPLQKFLQNVFGTQNVLVTKEAGYDNRFSFIMPDYDVALSAQFKSIGDGSGILPLTGDYMGNKFAAIAICALLPSILGGVALLHSVYAARGASTNCGTSAAFGASTDRGTSAARDVSAARGARKNRSKRRA